VEVPPLNYAPSPHSEFKANSNLQVRIYFEFKANPNFEFCIYVEFNTYKLMTNFDLVKF